MPRDLLKLSPASVPRAMPSGSTRNPAPWVTRRGGWLVWCVWVALAWGFLPWTSAEAKPLQIMLLGDAITASEEGRRSYRYYLWRRLVDEQLEFDFIGTQHTNHGGKGYWPKYKDLEFDRDHEAYRDWRIDHVVNGKDGEEQKGNLEKWLDGYTPDIAVVLLGSHDVLQAKQTEWAEREMRRVIEILRADNDRIAILMVVPPPMQHENADFLAPLGAAYAGLAERETTVNSPIRLVDLPRVFDSQLHLAYDGVQPNDAGERLIAAQVASSLLLLDEAHLDPVRRTSVQAWGSVLVVPLGAALGFFLLARSQLRREREAATYNLASRSGANGNVMAGRASRVSAVSTEESSSLTFPGPSKSS